MENIQTLIHIQDHIESKSYIYTNDLNKECSFVECYEFLCNNYINKQRLYSENDKIEIKYNITDDHCEIFCDNTEVVNGWVWNTTTKKVKVLYELTKIPILHTHKEKHELKNAFTQTEKTEAITNFTQTQETEAITAFTQTPAFTQDKEAITVFTQTPVFTQEKEAKTAFTQTPTSTQEKEAKTVFTQTQEKEAKTVFTQTQDKEAKSALKQLYETYNPNLFTEMFSNEKFKRNNSNYSSISTIFDDDNHVDFTLSNNFGYAYNPFNPINNISYNSVKNTKTSKNDRNVSSVIFPRPNLDALNQELKEVLSKPNFGLKILPSKKND